MTGRFATARARSDDYDDKRRRIRDAAAQLFADHGFAATSVAMLADASGGSKAWIYHYYDSKEAVLADLLRAYTADLLALVEAADDAALPPRARLTRLVAAILRSYDDAETRHAAILNDLPRLPVDQQREIRATQREVVAVLEGALAAASVRLAGHPELLSPLTMSVFGMLNWYPRWFHADGSLGFEDYVDMVVALVLDGVDGLSAGEPTAAADHVRA